MFGAMRGCEFITEPLTMPSNAHDLDLCLDTMVNGFRQIIDSLDEKPVAISFAFPGPADYPHGIIGGYLPNFPSFRNGVALGPFLEHEFGLPVYINNDGDLFAYGEALCGALPEINSRLAEAGSSKRFNNLLGYTFGTGFGVGERTAQPRRQLVCGNLLPAPQDQKRRDNRRRRVGARCKACLRRGFG